MIRKLVIVGILLNAAVALCSCGGGSATPIYSPSCNENISGCFKSVRIAKYKDNKEAAASYTFDDGTASSFNIASIFEKFDFRASFNIVPGFVEAHPLSWALWRGLVEKGHDIGNHSMDHIKLTDMALSDDELDTQINGAQRLIEEKIGVRPLVFVFPFDAYNDRSARVAYTNHFVTRAPGFSSDHSYQIVGFVSSLSIDKANANLRDSVNVGGWFVAAGHGIDGNGFSPVTSQFLQDHLEFARSLSSKLWVDTFLNVARYRLCRDQVTPQVTVTSANTASLRLVGSFSHTLCTEPLTILMPSGDVPHGELHVYTESGATVPVIESMGMLLLNVRPGEEVKLKIS